MLSKDEITESRHLAKLIRSIKNSDYNAITWEAAIEQVIREHARDDEDFFRKRALMEFFLNEGRQRRMSLVIKPFSIKLGSNEALDHFLKGLDDRIAELKERDGDYIITQSEQREISERVDAALARIGEPHDRDSSFDYYQLLIDRVFISDTVDSLLARITDLSTVLERYYPSAFQEVHILARLASKWPALAEATAQNATKKELAAHLDLNPDDIGLIMARMAQIGAVEISKRGRENLYRFIDTKIDTNRLRKEWTWLWAHPYKQPSLKLYNRSDHCLPPPSCE